MKSTLGILLFVLVVAGFGIKASINCGGDTWVDTYAIVAIANKVIPSFDICSY
ncbi:hypothetical protein Q8G38_16930 [Halomonas venusta]|uniref:hypothetical protein n=1 Tax=Vreelandella venusta TaxID=44935 RepID=UPI00295F1752|nr:hypothetical protein [Halomonas venusta]MDW0361001.1 hypothetical protein [Halomonas venusta]